jgi:predicted ArsR family transcriptional regulator
MKSKRRRWDETIQWLHDHWKGPITARELAAERKTSDAAALQVLRRLRGWGYVRLSQFSNSGKAGRPAHAYTLTEKGTRRVAWKNGPGK